MQGTGKEIAPKTIFFQENEKQILI